MKYIMRGEVKNQGNWKFIRIFGKYFYPYLFATNMDMNIIFLDIKAHQPS